MFGFHLHHKDDVLQNLSALRTALADKDPGAMKELEQQATAKTFASRPSPASTPPWPPPRPKTTLRPSNISPTTSSPASSSPP
jgi:hypothetical protein